MDIKQGDVVTLKKQHPCGGRDFEVMRAGVDFRLKCLGCGTQVWLSRAVLEKRVCKSPDRGIGE